MANITMKEETFAQLQEAKRRLQSIESREHQTPRPKIQRVPHHLRSRENFANYYTPRLVSFGPIHHGDPDLKLGEQYKLLWAAMYIDGSQKGAEHLYGKIVENIKEFKHLYTKDAIRHFDEEKLGLIFFVDGCSLLQFMDKFDPMKPDKLKVKVDQLVLVYQDVLLLENQLPFQVLKLLNDDNDAKLMKIIHGFLFCLRVSQDEPNGMSPEDEDREYKVVDVQFPPSPHILHHLRMVVLLNFRPGHKHKMMLHDFHPELIAEITTTYRNITELREAGIRVKRSHSPCPIDISFSSRWQFAGELEIPPIMVNNTIAPTYLNVIAYEMCPDFENSYEFSSYVEFLGSLIDNPDDVKELRLAGVLHNSLGSDEEVAKFFNTVSADLVPNTSIYASVRARIEKHYRSKYGTFLAQLYHTYFGAPWSSFTFIQTIIGLSLTFIQTWIAVHQSK